MSPDYGLPAEQLAHKYNPEGDHDPDDGDGEHPEFTRWDWTQAVAQRSTVRGYWDWVCIRLDEQGDKERLERLK